MTSILWPVLAQIGWTMLLYAWLTLARKQAVDSGEVDYSAFLLGGDEPLVPARIARNLSNQFELPVVFYALVILLLVFNRVTGVDIIAAWVFVAGRVAHLRDGGAIFERHAVADVLVTLAGPRVNLDSGAWLSIEPTAALVAVDVNLGRATSEPVSVDIAAAREIARQIRLRDLGGLVVIDFLRLSKPGERARLLEALKRATAGDRKRVDVLGYTAGGTIELTRARARGGALD